jgi:hypothetical protein
MVYLQGVLNMFEDLLETVMGPWGLLAAALIVFPGGRKFLRSATKEAIRAGVVVGDKVKELASEIKEEASDVVAEVRAERGDGFGNRATTAEQRGKQSKVTSIS